MPSLAQIGSPVATAMLRGAEMLQGAAERGLDYAIQAGAEDAATRGAAITFTRSTDAAGNQVLDLPELRANDHTPSSKAFNRAVLVNFGNALDAEAKATLGKLALDNPNDPAAFATRADAYIDGVLKGAPEQVRGAASVSLGKMKGEYGLHIEQEVRRDNDTKQISQGYIIQQGLEAEAIKRAGSQGTNSEDVQVARQVAVDGWNAFLTQHGNVMSPELQRYAMTADKRITEGQVSGIMRTEVADAFAKGGAPGAKAHIEKMRAVYLGLMTPGTLGYGLAAEQIDKLMGRAEAFSQLLHADVERQHTDRRRRESDLERDMTIRYFGAIAKIQDAGGPTMAAQITAVNKQFLASVAPGSFLLPVVMRLTRGDLSTPTAEEIKDKLVAQANLAEAVTNATSAEGLLDAIKTAVEQNLAPAAVLQEAQRWLPARQRQTDALNRQIDADNAFHAGMRAALDKQVPAAEQPGMPAKWESYVRANMNGLEQPEDRLKAFELIAQHGMLGAEVKDWITRTLSSTDVARNVEMQGLMVIATQNPKIAAAIKSEMGPALSTRLSTRLDAMSQISNGATPQARQVAIQNIVERDDRIANMTQEQQQSMLRNNFGDDQVIRTHTDKALPGQIADSLSGGRWALTNTVLGVLGFGGAGAANVVPGSPKATSDFFNLLPESAATMYGKDGFLAWWGKQGAFASASSFSDRPMISTEAKAAYEENVKTRVIGGQPRDVAERAALLDDMSNWGVTYVATSLNVQEQRDMQTRGMYVKNPLEKRLANLGYDTADSFGWMIGAVRKQMDIIQGDLGNARITLPFSVKGEPEALSIARALKRGVITFRADDRGGPLGYHIAIAGEHKDDRSLYYSPNAISLPSSSSKSADELVERERIASFVEEHYPKADALQKSALRSVIALEKKYPGVGLAMREAASAAPYMMLEAGAAPSADVFATGRPLTPPSP